MTKQEFINTLSKKLSGIPQEDRNKSLEYYSEMIDDRIEDGLSEEKAVNAMGNISDIAEKIIHETPIEKLIKSRVTPKRRLSGGEIALIAVGFPIWFPLLISFIAVFFIFYITLWILILCIYVADLSFAFVGIASLIAFAANLINNQPIQAWFIIGLGFIASGLSIPIFLAGNKASFGLIHCTDLFLKKIKSKIAKRKVGKNEEN